jgi:hypothetical protein
MGFYSTIWVDGHQRMTNIAALPDKTLLMLLQDVKLVSNFAEDQGLGLVDKDVVIQQTELLKLAQQQQQPLLTITSAAQLLKRHVPLLEQLSIQQKKVILEVKLSASVF